MFIKHNTNAIVSHRPVSVAVTSTAVIAVLPGSGVMKCHSAPWMLSGVCSTASPVALTIDSRAGKSSILMLLAGFLHWTLHMAVPVFLFQVRCCAVATQRSALGQHLLW